MSILARLDTADRRTLLASFIRFGTVGASGFVVDTTTVYILKSTIGLYWAGGASYLVAATWTWWFNRQWTFRGQGDGTLVRQWLKFLAANTAGLILNRGAYFTLVTLSPLCRDWPILAIAAGTGCGMFVNFFLSRRLVFR